MSTNQDINHKTRSATKGAVCRNESENQTVQCRACEEDTIDMIHHHNERGKKERGSVPKTEPAELDYESEGLMPHN